MASLKINTGLITLDVEDADGTVRGKFSFNPKDVQGMKKLIALQKDLDSKQDEWQKKAEELDESNEIDAEKAIDLLHEFIQYFKNAIDDIYGVGSSQVLFGNVETFEMIDQFFDGVLPYYVDASNERINKHLDKYK